LEAPELVMKFPLSQALPALVFWPSAHPAAPVLATGGQCRRRIATVGKSEHRRRAPCPMRQLSEIKTYLRECHRALAGLTPFLWLLSLGEQRKSPGCRPGPANWIFRFWFGLLPRSKTRPRVASRRTPYFLSKRPQKVSKKGLSPAEGMAFAGGGGFFRRSSS